MSDIRKTAITNLDESINEKISLVFGRILLFLPLPVILISAVIIELGDPVKGMVILLANIPIILTYFLLRAGNIRWSVLIITVLMNLVVTWSCIVGNGVHDLSIIVYPFIILLAGLILLKRDLYFVSGLVIVCLSVIVVGEQIGQFQYASPPPGRLADLIIIALVFAGGMFATSSLTQVIKKAIHDSQKELKAEEKYSEAIAKSVSEREALLRQVHHRVKNHLSMINSILEIDRMSKGSQDTEDIKDLVITIARMHDSLFQGIDYKQVSLASYIPSMSESFSAMAKVNMEITCMDKMDKTSTNTAILVALCLNELIQFCKNQDNSSLKTSLDQLDDIITLRAEFKIQESGFTHQTQKRLNYIGSKLGAEHHLTIYDKKGRFELSFPTTLRHTSTQSQSA